MKKTCKLEIEATDEMVSVSVSGPDLEGFHVSIDREAFERGYVEGFGPWSRLMRQEFFETFGAFIEQEFVEAAR